MPDVIAHLPGLSIQRVLLGQQWLLHADPSDVQALAAATGLSLPTKILTSGDASGWSALHLSPDEWLLVATGGEQGEGLAAQMEASGIAFSLVDVSDRSLALDVTGPLACDTLAGGCPIDLERMSDDCCTRTLLGKVTVLLRRCGDRWQLHYARSLDGYVVELLRVCAQDVTMSSSV